MSESAAASPALSASSLYLSFDPPPPHTVEEAGQNHFERFTPPLSSVERFYVHVAQAFAQQEIDRRSAAASPTGGGSPSPASASTAVEPSAQRGRDSSALIVQQLARSAASLDAFLAMIDNVLTHRQLSLALTHPLKDPRASDGDDPASPAFLLTRRNRFAVLLQSHASHLQATATLLARGAAALKASLRLHHRFMGDLQRLSSHWLVRHRPTTATGALPPLMVDIAMEDIAVAGASRVMLRRDDDGRVAVDDSVGKRTLGEEARDKARRQRRHERQQRREERRHSMHDADDEWKEDEPTPPPLPTFISSSSSARGWQGAASRLHRAQRQLLHAHVHALLLKETQGFSMGQLCSVSVVHHRITVESSAFPTLWIDWDDGPTGPFILRTASRRLTAVVEGCALHLSLLPPLLVHYARYATSNKPLALASLASPLPVPPPPPLLSHVITCVYHAHLALSIRRMLPILVLAHPSVSLTMAAPPELNVLTFSLHRGGVFMMHCTVTGVDIAVVIRRNVRARAVGLARGAVSTTASEWTTAVDGESGHASVDLVACTSLQHLEQLVAFAVHQPLHPDALL